MACFRTTAPADDKRGVPAEVLPGVNLVRRSHVTLKDHSAVHPINQQELTLRFKSSKQTPQSGSSFEPRRM